MRKLIPWPRAVCRLVVTAFVVNPAGPATAASCSDLSGHTVRWIVPYSAGGGYDLISRLIEPELEAEIGAEIAIENVPGAGGIVGSKRLRDAAADGRTLGILNAPGLLAAMLEDADDAPRLGSDFTVLGRVARNQHVMVTGAQSRFRTLDDLFAASEADPVIVAVSEIGGTPFISGALVTDLLGMPTQLVAGYPGSKELVLALVRGEADLVSLNFDSIVPQIESGELRPLLQVGTAPIAKEAVLADVPVLGGAHGIAAARAVALGRDAATIDAEVEAAVALLGAGRLIAAPAGLPTEIADCERGAPAAVLADPAFLAAAATAKQRLEPADAHAAMTTATTAAEAIERLGPRLKSAIDRIRS